MHDRTPAPKTIWGRLRRARLDERLIFFLLLALLLAALLPMLIIAFYDVPCADDFSYGGAGHQAWVETHSPLRVLAAAFQQVIRWYRGWQGTFSAVFVFALQPAVFGARWYFLTTFIMLAALAAGTGCLAIAILHRILGAGKYQAGIVTVILLAAFTQLLPSPVESFYWFNGSSYYTFFFGLSLVLYAHLADAVLAPERRRSPLRQAGRLIWITLLCVLIGGCNYTTALITTLLFAGALLVAVLRWRWRELVLLIPFAALCVSFVISVTAPGNAVRQASYPDHPSAVQAILRSFSTAADYALTWTTPLLLCLLIFLVPLLYRIAKRSSCSFRLPLLFLAGSFCLLSAMFCPPIYAMGNSGPDRLHNVIFFAYVLLSTADLLYCLGWLARQWEKRNSARAEEERRGAFPVLFAGLMACLFAAALLTGHQHITSRSAAGSLAYGEAAAYHAVFEERLALLEDDSVTDPVLEPYSVKPYLLFFDDVTTDPEHWTNRAMSSYFGKDTVRLSEN